MPLRKDRNRPKRTNNFQKPKKEEKKMFRGTGTAIVTPFKGQEVDYDNLGRFIQFQIDNGINALIVLGTTGEAPSVTEQEREEIITFAVKKTAKRVPVIVGTGSNSTSHTVEMSSQALELGADGVLVVTPYYNKPTQEGLFQHYREVANNIDGPLVIYNVPGRTGANILPDTVVRCSEIENIVAVKEASGDMIQVDQLIRKIRKVRPDFRIYSGNDDQAFHLACSGGDGVISVLSNVAPGQTSAMINATLEGDLERGRQIHMELFPLMRDLFVETNPIPVKYAVSRIGYCENSLRLPLVQASRNAMDKVDASLAECGVTA